MFPMLEKFISTLKLIKCSELKTLECDILNPDLLTFLEIKFIIFYLDIKKKFGLSINPAIDHSKVFSSVKLKIITCLPSFQ